MWDGLALRDAAYTSDATMMSVSHSGFTDEESGIDHYIWCVGVTVEDDLHDCHNIGLQLQASIVLETTVQSGLLFIYCMCCFMHS